MIALPGKLMIMNIYYKLICHVEKHCGLYKGVDTCADTQALWFLYKLGAKIIVAWAMEHIQNTITMNMGHCGLY